MSSFFEIFTLPLDQALWRFWHILLTFPSDTTPLIALLLMPFIAVVALAFGKLSRLRRFRYRKVLFLILSKKYLGHRSHVLDVMLLAGNLGLFALICAQATVSIVAVTELATWVLAGAFGASTPTTLGPWTVGVVWMVVLFLAYELAYFTDHYLSHMIPFLWEFHKVHHSAEVLSPLTNFRVHPIDSLVFVNIVAVITGLASGLLTYTLGAGPVSLGTWSGTTVLALAIVIFSQFQHTHIWLPLTGFWGRIVLSPAHHQIHHSVDAQHHNKNMGNLIAVFDWMFGTLHIPSKTREKLVFGVDASIKQTHDINEGLVQPFADAAKHLMPQSGSANGVQPATPAR